MDNLNELRKEIRADFALLEARQADMGRQMMAIAETAEDAAKAAQEAAKAAQEAAKAAQEAAKAAATAGREAADHFRWTGGRMRLMNDRFDTFLSALERQQGQSQKDIEDLKIRVTRLEQGHSPAA